MTVALYCRVSTDEQAQQGFSIDHQKERMEAFCLSQGWADYEFYVDDGYTGKNLERPQLQRLLGHLHHGRIETVVVYKLDRLSRRQKDVLYLLEDVFENHHVAFRSVTEPFDTGTAFGKAMIGVLAVFAQLERDTILDRTRTGKRQRTRQGMWYGGPVPFGYRWDTESQQLRVVESQAALIREMFHRFLQGQSFSSLGTWMDKRSTDRLFSHHKTILYVLTNPLYAGKLNLRGELVDGNHVAIVDLETWLRAQEEVQNRRAERASYGKYLLSNLLVCGVCGSPMKHIRIEDKRRARTTIRNYYLCSAKHRKASACTSRYVVQEVLEDQVASRVKQLTLDAQSVQDTLIGTLEESLQSAQLKVQLSMQLGETNKKLKRWYDAFESGKLDVEALGERVEALEQERIRLITRMKELGTDRESNHSTSLMESLETVGQQWENLTFEEQSMVLRAALHRITVYPTGELEFEWNVQ